MIYDTIIAIALERYGLLDRYGTLVRDLTTTDLFNIMLDLKQKGYLRFDYEFLTVPNGKVSNPEIHELKYFIIQIYTHLYGMQKINEQIINEQVYRLTIINNGGWIREDQETSSSSSSSSSTSSESSSSYSSSSELLFSMKMQNPDFFSSSSSSSTYARMLYYYNGSEWKELSFYEESNECKNKSPIYIDASYKDGGLILMEYPCDSGEWIFQNKENIICKHIEGKLGIYSNEWTVAENNS